MTIDNDSAIKLPSALVAALISDRTQLLVALTEEQLKECDVLAVVKYLAGHLIVTKEECRLAHAAHERALLKLVAAQDAADNLRSRIASILQNEDE